jgi:hypothetical protein
MSLLLFCCYFCRSKEDVPSVTEADASIRSFLERRLGYKVKDTMAIQVGQLS